MQLNLNLNISSLHSNLGFIFSGMILIPILFLIQVLFRLYFERMSEMAWGEMMENFKTR